MRTVVKIGGFAFQDEILDRLNKEYAKVANEIHSRGDQIAIVVGGGKKARYYIEAARRLGGKETLCDQIGILMSRINALVLISSIGVAASQIVPTTLKEAVNLYSIGKILVSGGLTPAQSTNAVAALIAEATMADMLIHLTDVDGVYNKDPKKHSDAEKMDQVSMAQLKQLVSPTGIQAGQYVLLDPTALGVIERSKLKVRIANGLDPQNIRRILEGEKIGTALKS